MRHWTFCTYSIDVKRDCLEPEEFIEQIKQTFSRASVLPDWMQLILLEDINAAIENRIRTMELIIQAKPRESEQ
jgi:hypothetical protein